MVFKTILCLVITLLASYWAIAQESVHCAEETAERIKQHKLLGIITGMDLTYTGISAFAGVEYERKKHAIYGAPRISITDSYIPGRGPFGIITGYKYFFMNTHDRWKVYFGLHYNGLRYKAFKEQGSSSSHKNYVHEISAGYGAELIAYKNFHIGNSVNLGKYYESYYNHINQKRRIFSGYNTLVRLYVKYKI